MMEDQSSLVAGHEDEGRTAYVALDSQAKRYPLGETGLSRAQWPSQQENISGRGVLADGPAQVLGEIGAARFDVQRGVHGLILGRAEMVPTPFAELELFTVGVDQRDPAGLAFQNLTHDGSPAG